MDISELQKKTIPELFEVAKELKIPNFRQFRKHDLVFKILEAKTESNGLIFAKGVLEILPEGYGFLRTETYLPSADDIYVSQTQIRRFDLANGDFIQGQVRPPKDGEKYFSLLKIEAVNGQDPESIRERVPFDAMIPIFPDQRIVLENPGCPIAARLIDLVSPIGTGQRGMIVSPPKAGKTTILKNIANSVSTNFPDYKIKILLVDERPEEVTDMQRSTKGEVISSTFDEPPENHIRIAELCLESAKRLVEANQNVVILLDSITRLARAYNLVTPPSGRTLSGGLDPTCLHRPKRFFGAARNLEGGGSLTILATALVETGSRMDDVIYEEFKGTGNMELHLNRKLSDRRIFPAIDVRMSGTRREELLLGDDELKKVWLLRKVLDSFEGSESTEQLIDRLQEYKSNKQFLDSANVK
ncbi:MAG: transcription termination factor Rho [Candidatus Margulisiibacteriota bacterium]